MFLADTRSERLIEVQGSPPGYAIIRLENNGVKSQRSSSTRYIDPVSHKVRAVNGMGVSDQWSR